MNRLSTFALIVAGSFALAAPALAEPPVKALVDAKAAYERLKGEVDSFAGQWRRGLDGLSRNTPTGDLTSRTNTLWAKLVHFQGAACLTKDDALKIRTYLKDAAERQAIVTEAPRSTTVATFQTDSQSVDCKDNQMTGHIIFRDVRFTAMPVH